MTDDTTDAAIIIGAGISGLGAALALERRGIVPRILDADPRPGETWRRRHPQLRLNTHRRFSALPGLALPWYGGPYPHRDEIAAYVARYADRLAAPIAHNAQVTGIAPDGGAWRVRTDSGDYRARKVIVATGHDREPYIPPWPVLDAWPGRLIRAADLGDVRQYAGKRVLVVGAGNSGCDAISHLLRVETAELMVSVRYGQWIFPRWLGRFPALRLAPLLARIPRPLLDPLVAGIARELYGDLRRYGLPRHPWGLARRLEATGVAPAIDDGMVAALKAGRLKVVPAISYFRADGVRLEDFRLVAPDVVIAATGYRTGLEAILPDPGLLTGRGTPRIHGAAQAPGYPGLFFIGMRPRLTGFFLAAGTVGAEIAGAVAQRERAAARSRRARPRPAQPAGGGAAKAGALNWRR